MRGYYRKQVNDRVENVSNSNIQIRSYSSQDRWMLEWYYGTTGPRKNYNFVTGQFEI